MSSNPLASPPPQLPTASGEARATSDGQSVTVSASATGGAVACASGTVGTSKPDACSEESRKTATTSSQDSLSFESSSKDKFPPPNSD